ncbi:SulP family inorganic anion transporter [Fundidesulfovibrio butyratiphilus]
MTKLGQAMAWISAHVFFPAPCPWRGAVSRAGLKADLMAGLTGAIIVLPQGVAFALVAGLPPEMGLYTAMVPTVLAALFGSSHHLVSGPTTAISIVIFTNVSAMAQPFTPDYIQMVLALTFLAGFFQLVLGMARLGGIINFVSLSVMTGFTAGAAVLIAMGQVGHLLGVELPKQSFPLFLRHLPLAVAQANPQAVAVGGCALAVAAVLRRTAPRLPGLLLALVAASLLAWFLDGQARGLHFVGALPEGLPPLSWPFVEVSRVGELIPGALAVAMLGLAEAVSIARAAAARTGQRLDNNQEFAAQGLANLAGGFFSAYASSGSFTRTGVNLEAGAATPLSAIVSAVCVAGVVLLVAPLTAWLPLSAVAGALVVVAASLVHVPDILRVVRTSRSETVVMALTAGSSLVVSLEFALFAGVMLSLLFYLNRTAHPHFIAIAPDASSPKRPWRNAVAFDLPECPQLLVLRLDGSIFFGAVNHISEELHHILANQSERRHVLIVASGVNFIDVTGCQMLFQERTSLAREGRRLYMCSLKREVLDFLRRGGCMRGLGEGEVFVQKTDALRSILANLDERVCACCDKRVFTECAKLPQGYCALD